MELVFTSAFFFLNFQSVISVELFPKVSLPKKSEDVTFKECSGTNVGFAISGNLSDHYTSLKRHYSGCTFVNGNLEVTNLVSKGIRYDVDFLKDIEIVTGYVLIGLVTEVEKISLPKLKLIRADSTFSVLGSDYGLVVTLTSRNMTNGLRSLQMPALKEISRGNVLFLENPLLCHVDTIDWDHLTPNRDNVLHMKKHGHSTNCEPCSSHCRHGNVSRCWGPEDNLCQKVNTMTCPSSCLNHCFSTDVFGCCHTECAVGCTGPTDTDCVMCKYFLHKNQCVSSCPDDHYFIGQQCILNPFLFPSTQTHESVTQATTTAAHTKPDLPQQPQSNPQVSDSNPEDFDSNNDVSDSNTEVLDSNSEVSDQRHEVFDSNSEVSEQRHEVSYSNHEVSQSNSEISSEDYTDVSESNSEAVSEDSAEVSEFSHKVSDTNSQVSESDFDLLNNNPQHSEENRENSDSKSDSLIRSDVQSDHRSDTNIVDEFLSIQYNFDDKEYENSEEVFRLSTITPQHFTVTSPSDVSTDSVTHSNHLTGGPEKESSDIDSETQADVAMDTSKMEHTAKSQDTKSKLENPHPGELQEKDVLKEITKFTSTEIHNDKSLKTTVQPELNFKNTILAQSIIKDHFQPESTFKNTIQSEFESKNNIQSESLSENTVAKNTIQSESVAKNTIQSEMLFKHTLQPDSANEKQEYRAEITSSSADVDKDNKEGQTTLTNHLETDNKENNGETAS